MKPSVQRPLYNVLYVVAAIIVSMMFLATTWMIHKLAMPDFGAQGVTKVEDLSASGNVTAGTTSANTFNVNSTTDLLGPSTVHAFSQTSDTENLTGTGVTWTPSSTASLVILSCDPGTTVDNITASTTGRVIDGYFNGDNDCTFVQLAGGTGNIATPGVLSAANNLVLQAGDPFHLTYDGSLWHISTSRVSSISAGTSLSSSNPELGGNTTLSVNLPGGTCTTGQFVNRLDSDGTAHCAAAGGGGGSGGLFNQILSATPTQSSTGLTTWVNQPTGATVTDAADGLVLHSSTSGTTNRSILSAAAPAVPFSITALVTMNQGPTIGVGVSNGTTMQGFDITLNAAAPDICVSQATPPSTGAWSACTTYRPSGGALEWVKFTMDAAHEMTFFESSDGVAWRNIGGPFGGYTGYNTIVFAVDGSTGPADGTILSWTQGTN